MVIYSTNKYNILDSKNNKIINPPDGHYLNYADNELGMYCFASYEEYYSESINPINNSKYYTKIPTSYIVRNAEIKFI